MKIKKYLTELKTHCKRFSRGWDYYCIASDAWLAGFNYYKENKDSEDLIEVDESENGLHQLTPRTFFKWKKETYELPFQEALKLYLPMFEFSDLRVIEEDGIISIQASGKRVKLNSDFNF